jgi:hypothetical protein
MAGIPRSIAARFGSLNRILGANIAALSKKGRFDAIRKQICRTASSLERNGFRVGYLLNIKTKLFAKEVGIEHPLAVGTIGRLETGKLRSPRSKYYDTICFYSEWLKIYAPCSRCRDIHCINPVLIPPNVPSADLPKPVAKSINDLELGICGSIDRMLYEEVFDQIIHHLRKFEKRNQKPRELECCLQFHGALGVGLGNEIVQTSEISGIYSEPRFAYNYRGKVRQFYSVEELQEVTGIECSLSLKTPRPVCQFCEGNGYLT